MRRVFATRVMGVALVLQLAAAAADGQERSPAAANQPKPAWYSLGPIQDLGAGITPGICVDRAGRIHVVFMDAGKIFYRQADAAARFGPAEEVPAPEGPAVYNSPHLVCDAEGTVHLAFERDFTKASRKCWYTNRRKGKWSAPVLALDRSGGDQRVNYPRLAVSGDDVFIGGFVGGGSAIVKLSTSGAVPVVTGAVDTPLWVAHPLLAETAQLCVVGRHGARGHWLERYSPDLKLIGDRVLLSRGTPTKTFEPTAAIVDGAGVIHAAGASGSPVQVAWYNTSLRAVADRDVILGPELGHDVAEYSYPVIQHDDQKRIILSFRHFESGEGRLVVLENGSEAFSDAVTVAPAVHKRLRWNPHLAAAPGGGVYLAWDVDGRVFFRSAGVAAAAEGAATHVVGKGGVDGCVATGSDGTIHVVFGGRYRQGPAPDRLGVEEAVTDVGPMNTVRMVVDSRGRPHVVFTTGQTDKATRSYYTARIDGRWLPAEKFADAEEIPERTRAYVADVAVDERGNVLTSFWIGRPTEKRAERDNPSFLYRWRNPDGRWSEPQSLPAHWSSAAKVEYAPGRGFFLLWQSINIDWRITGPVGAGQKFAEAQSFPTGSNQLRGLSTVQNEGADFTLAQDGIIVAAGNVREKFEGPVGVWAAVGKGEAISPATYLGSFEGTKRGDESGVHPVAAFDAATGSAFLTVMNPADKRAYFVGHGPARGWQGYQPLLPDRPAPQGTLRQGPSVADLPGPGVVALVRDGEQQWHLKVLQPPNR